MRVETLIQRLQEFDPDTEVIIVCESGSEHQIEDLDLADSGEVVIEVVINGG